MHVESRNARLGVLSVRVKKPSKPYASSWCARNVRLPGTSTDRYDPRPVTRRFRIRTPRARYDHCVTRRRVCTSSRFTRRGISKRHTNEIAREKYTPGHPHGQRPRNTDLRDRADTRPCRTRVHWFSRQTLTSRTFNFQTLQDTVSCDRKRRRQTRFYCIEIQIAFVVWTFTIRT